MSGLGSRPPLAPVAIPPSTYLPEGDVVTQHETVECGWTSQSWLFGNEKCEEPATRVVTTGCVHEHLYPCPTCDDCLPVVKRSLERGLLCTPCANSGTDGVPVVLVSDEPLPALAAGGAL